MPAIATERAALHAVLSSAAKAGRGASVMRIRMGGGEMEVTCGGMERSVTVGSVSANDPVEVIVPVDVVTAVDKMRADEVSIESDGTNVVIASGQTRLVFPVSTNVVPEVPLSSASMSMALSGAEVRRVAAQVVPFASKDGSRPALVAVHLNGEQGNVTATDSYRFAVLDVEWLDERADALVVPGDWQIAASTFRDEDEVIVSVTDRVVRFETEGITMTSRQQAADVISWADRIPQWDDAQAVTLNAGELRNAVDLVGLSSADKRAHLIVSSSGVWVVAASHGGTSKVRVQHEGSAEAHVVINVALAESVISRCGSDAVRLAFAEKGPVLVRGESNEWLAGLMPMTCPDEEKERVRSEVDGD